MDNLDLELCPTMGNLITTNNENEPENIEKPESTDKKIEVNELELNNETSDVKNVAEDVEKDVINEIDAYAEKLSEQDINLIIMGNSDVSTSSKLEIEEQEALWLSGNTRNLIKVDADEDLDVIVKSLETAIVETERYDIIESVKENQSELLDDFLPPTTESHKNEFVLNTDMGLAKPEDVLKEEDELESADLEDTAEESDLVGIQEMVNEIDETVKESLISLDDYTESQNIDQTKIDNNLDSSSNERIDSKLQETEIFINKEEKNESDEVESILQMEIEDCTKNSQNNLKITEIMEGKTEEEKNIVNLMNIIEEKDIVDELTDINLKDNENLEQINEQISIPFNENEKEQIKSESNDSNTIINLISSVKQENNQNDVKLTSNETFDTISTSNIDISPKKIKLIREKAPTLQFPQIKSIPRPIETDTLLETSEKLDENKDKVKTRKLKLKRNYNPIIQDKNIKEKNKIKDIEHENVAVQNVEINKPTEKEVNIKEIKEICSKDDSMQISEFEPLKESKLIDDETKNQEVLIEIMPKRTLEEVVEKQDTKISAIQIQIDEPMDADIIDNKDDNQEKKLAEKIIIKDESTATTNEDIIQNEENNTTVQKIDNEKIEIAAEEEIIHNIDNNITMEDNNILIEEKIECENKDNVKEVKKDVVEIELIEKDSIGLITYENEELENKNEQIKENTVKIELDNLIIDEDNVENVELKKEGEPVDENNLKIESYEINEKIDNLDNLSDTVDNLETSEITSSLISKNKDVMLSNKVEDCSANEENLPLLEEIENIYSSSRIEQDNENNQSLFIENQNISYQNVNNPIAIDLNEKSNQPLAIEKICKENLSLNLFDVTNEANQSLVLTEEEKEEICNKNLDNINLFNLTEEANQSLVTENEDCDDNSVNTIDLNKEYNQSLLLEDKDNENINVINPVQEDKMSILTDTIEKNENLEKILTVNEEIKESKSDAYQIINAETIKIVENLNIDSVLDDSKSAIIESTEILQEKMEVEVFDAYNDIKSMENIPEVEKLDDLFQVEEQINKNDELEIVSQSSNNDTLQLHENLSESLIEKNIEEDKSVVSTECVNIEIKQLNDGFTESVATTKIEIHQELCESIFKQDIEESKFSENAANFKYELPQNNAEDILSKDTGFFVKNVVCKENVKAKDESNENTVVIDENYPLLSSCLQGSIIRKSPLSDYKLTVMSQEIKKSPVTKQNSPVFVSDMSTKSEMKIKDPIEDESKVVSSELFKSGTSALTKIRINKRKVDEREFYSEEITKPLSVLVDDLENTVTETEYLSATVLQKDPESIPKLVIKSKPRTEEKSSPKITIKPIKPPEESNKRLKTSEELSHSPKITIKPIVKPDPLKITITKQKTDDTHSILKIYHPDDNQMCLNVSQKATIKPKADEVHHSPKITFKPLKPPSSTSPKVTVKPVSSPVDQIEITHSPKVTIKPIVRPEESAQMSPRAIKIKSMTFESSSGVTVEPICGSGSSIQKSGVDNSQSLLKSQLKAYQKIEEAHSPKLSIKPITKTCEIVQSEDGVSNPLKLTIKPIVKPEETSYQSPKITIKPIVKPEESEYDELEKPERIILKIQKTNLPSPKERSSSLVKELKKEQEIKIEAIPNDQIQKLDKIKLKLNKEGSHAQIIPADVSLTIKRPSNSFESLPEKRSRIEFPGSELLHSSDISINLIEPNSKPTIRTLTDEVTIMKIDKRMDSSKVAAVEQPISQLKFKEMLLKIQQKPDITCTPSNIGEDSNSSDDVKIVEVVNPLIDPLSINDENSSPDVMIINEILPDPFQNIKIINTQSLTDPNVTTPKKRGRPRKNPLEIKPEIKGEDCIEIRPKRTCRAPPGRTPFVVKERKPRGASRGRGSTRGRGGTQSPKKIAKELKAARAKALKEAKALAKAEAARLAKEARLPKEVPIEEIIIDDSTNDTPATTPVPLFETPTKRQVKETTLQMVEPANKIKEELLKQPHPPPAVYEEETRMSAESSSRAQTPATQVFTVPLAEGPEESQSSVQSSATTESKKKGRLEVCDPDSGVTVVDQIAEYSWGGGGPYMLQEQIAQFLGVKSFKRKYPGLTRRPVDMQERDYIREKGLVSESMCDMGLTAVPSTEILDIMYTDFQDKYEEYRKYQRDKQSKEISNKQRAISLATTQEKSKIDFKERAVRSAVNWNISFNKARKESRKCCMDLQTFTINYPAGSTKVPYKPPVGHYPIALVPGQYTDYYKSYTPSELNYLPLNTVRYGPVLPNQPYEGNISDGSQSETESSSGSDSDSSDESMSTEEEIPHTIICKPSSVQLTPLSSIKSRVH